MGENTGVSPSGRFEAQHRQIGRRSRRAYLKAGIWLFLALVAGVTIGVGVTLLYFRVRFRRPPPRAEQIGRSILNRLEDTVELTESEKARLEEIILFHMAEVEKVSAETFGAISEEFDRMNDQVDEILGSERSEKWEEMKRHRYGQYYRGKEDRHHHPSRRMMGPPASGGRRGMGPRH